MAETFDMTLDILVQNPTFWGTRLAEDEKTKRRKTCPTPHTIDARTYFPITKRA